MSGTVTMTRDGHVAEIQMNRPEKHNALTPAMYVQIRDLCEQINRDDAIHAVLWSGAGERAFCSGSDTQALDGYADFWAWRNRVDYIHPIRTLRKPTIAAVKGWALGGGHEIALACDIRVAATNTVFASPEVALGWLGAGGAAQHLTRLVGYGQAMKLLLTGDRIDATEAYRIGLVEFLVQPGEELPQARAIAQRIAAHSTVATQSVKAAVRSAMAGNIEQGYQMENELMALCFAVAEKTPGSMRYQGPDTTASS
ncbi:MAG: enoyl-CoA hydratase/isomerase family protein [Burkholderiaceae bacterium]